MISAVASRARKIIREGYEIGPRPHPCTCSAPRHAHAGAKWTGACEATGCRRYRRDLADSMAEEAMESYETRPLDDIVIWHKASYPRSAAKKKGWGVGPSDVTTCAHAIQLRERPPDDIVYNRVDKSAATLGDIFHDVIGRARKFRFPLRKYEFKVEIPGLDRPGRIDEFDVLNAVTTDYKTCGEFAWEWLGAYGPKEEHWQQVSIYAYALICLGYEVEAVRLIYINRATGEDEQFVRPYDEQFAKAALDKLIGILLSLDMGQELPREGRGPSSDQICAKFCRFRDYCWSTEAAAAAGRSPESWTILGEHPEAEAIEWAAGQARGWQDNKKDAEKEYKAAVPLLGGIPDGKYGDYLVKERKRWMPDYKEYYEAVRRAYETYLVTPPGQRGDFSDWLRDIPLKKRRDVWMEVKPVRVADKKKPENVSHTDVEPVNQVPV